MILGDTLIASHRVSGKRTQVFNENLSKSLPTAASSVRSWARYYSKFSAEEVATARQIHPGFGREYLDDSGVMVIRPEDILEQHQHSIDLSDSLAGHVILRSASMGAAAPTGQYDCYSLTKDDLNTLEGFVENKGAPLRDFSRDVSRLIKEEPVMIALRQKYKDSVGAQASGKRSKASDHKKQLTSTRNSL